MFGIFFISLFTTIAAKLALDFAPPMSSRLFGDYPVYGCGSTKKTFLISKVQANWTEAERLCVAGKMHLASIKNSREQLEVRNTMKKHDVHVAWIGANDLSGEGNFTWVADGTRVYDCYSNWARSEPNDLGGEQHCVAVTRVNRNRWFDTNCRVPRSFVCETYGGSKQTIE